MAARSICAPCLCPKLRKVFLALAAVAFAAAVPSIQFDHGVFRVDGWDAAREPSEGWSSVLAVYTGSGDAPAMLGSYDVTGHVLTFHPRFPSAAGVHYRAVFKAPGVERIEASFDVPSATTALTRVEKIFPSTDVLPSNALRFYIYFSAPMSRGEAWTHIHLVDADTSRTVEIPFLELDQELWDQNNQRLTVLFDPGRIKRGLVPTTTIGPAVVEGKHYKLVIDRDWHDARGVGLVEGFEKSFRGGPADRVAADPTKWRVDAPKAGTIEPLVVVFAKPMDYVLLQRMIGVSLDGREMAGAIEVRHNETEWRFTPREAWKAGAYRVAADNTLEDICGNHLDRPFDVDKFETVTQHITSKTTSLPFIVR